MALFCFRGVLGSVPIKKFFLPGTHNSGSYKKYEGSLSDTVVSRYSICQDEDIWSQLVYGKYYNFHQNCELLKVTLF